MYGGEIPFDQHGCPMPYVGYRAEAVWKENKPFRAVLTFQGFQRGRSSIKAIYVKSDDPTWEVGMFLSDFEALLKRDVSPLRITGRFVFIKRGSNYGIQQLLIDA